MNNLAIITVNHSDYENTSEFLESLNNQSKKEFKVFISDNSDKKKDFSYPTFTDVSKVENRGYAYGLNEGLRKALDQGFKKFVCINNDTTVAYDFVENVLKSLDKYKKSLIGGKIYYYKGFEYHKDRYESKDLGRILWYAGGNVDWKNALIRHRGVDEVDKGQYDSFVETSFVTGCLMCFDKELLDVVGFMDDSYFLYFEDADWNERIKRKALKLFYDPSIIIWHKNAQSTQGSGSKLHVRFQEKNRLKFGLKYAPLRTKLHLLKNAIIKL